MRMESHSAWLDSSITIAILAVASLFSQCHLCPSLQARKLYFKEITLRKNKEHRFIEENGLPKMGLEIKLDADLL